MRGVAVVLGVAVAGCGAAPGSVDESAGTTASVRETTSGESSTDGGSSTAASTEVATETTQPTTTETTSTSTSGVASETVTGSSSGDADEEPPAVPRTLMRYLTGDAADAPVQPTGPGLLVMGGGTDVDAAFTWQLQYMGGGDVVVLRTSGADGYNDYLFTEIGGVDSVETLMVTTQALAQEPYVAWTIEHAEAVFMAGGDQAAYLEAWKGTPVAAAIAGVYARGGVVGGTSAGAAVLGEFIYAAYNDSVIEDEALLDPYNMYMTFERDFLALPPMQGVITDTHFTARRRLCRLIGFVARVVADGWGEPVLGMGVDEETALVVGPDGVGTVLGVGKVHLLHSAGAPQQCVAGATLEYAALDLYTIAAGDEVQLPTGVPEGVDAITLSASQGALEPAYDCLE